jgi:flagellar protein FliS
MQTTKSMATSYQESQVNHAEPVQLIVMLYDGALVRIAEAKKRFAEHKDLQGQLAVTKAQAIVNELFKSLNFDEGKEVASNLSQLYRYLHDLLVKSLRKNSIEPLDEAERILNNLRGAWAEVANQCKDLVEGVQAAPGPAAAAYGSHPQASRLKVRA